ncbi:MAG: MFS transporter [Bacteroidales bacterium]
MEKRTRSFILVFILITSFVNPFMGSAVNLALPRISHELNLNAVQMSWVAMSFLLASAVMMVPMGKWADIKGRKYVFVLGTSLFGISSWVCAMSTTGSMLLMARAVQGIGGAMMFATNMAILTDIFPPQERGRVIGINVTAVYLGLSLAPVISGFMIKQWGWQSIFYFAALPVVLVSLLTFVLVNREWRDNTEGRFDIKGSLIYVISLSVMMYGFSHLPGRGPIAMTLAGALGMAWFVRVELKEENPVFDVRLLKSNRRFAFSNLAALINYAMTFAITFMLSLYLQYVKGLSPRDAGLILIAQPGLMALVAWVSGSLSDKYDPRWISSAGMAIITVGLLALIPLNTQTSLLYIFIVLAWIGLGFGIFSSPNTNAVMSSVPRSQLGTASATVGTMRLSGQMVSMGIATLLLHVFVGKSVIGTSNLAQFLAAQRTAFVIFVVLGLVGVWASWVRGENKVISLSPSGGRV